MGVEKSTTEQTRHSSRVPEYATDGLLATLNKGFSETWWKRYHDLVAMREAETIRHDELVELMALTNSMEDHNARRLGCLAAVAEQRGVTLADLMASLELQPLSD